MKVKTVRLLVGMLVLCVPAACLLCAVCSGQISGSSGEQNSIHGQFFFGTSQDVKYCPSAWLLYFDKAHNSGGVFVVASMEKFSRLELGEGGAVLVQWAGLGDKNYRFKGTLKSEELAGEVQLVDTRSGSSKYVCEVAATKLPPQNARANPEHQVVASRYSNTAYSNEGGDLTGVDIRFFSTGKGTEGMITFHEGYWDEPVNTPLVLSQIEMDKKTIRFAADTPNGVTHYHLVPTLTGALFNRDDMARTGGKDIRLKKMPTVLPAIGW
ncbi:hypothetical protein [Acidicapsa ligni]|uniref:hypothetical protein n=1 Tax=Acidicapsa ligni TaxID=542300 RepID=UPI0021DF4A58|nr:hypothetical protein [Acidicapsa ligni]